jgi:polynucleotide 5'-hydroxyl-kinase GRC3/NOL9
MMFPEEWIELGKKVVKRAGIALVIGKTDAGKSTLIRYLLQLALNQRRRVAVVDADIGQASFGPPTCMSLTLWPEFSPAAPDARSILRFIGSTSPAGHLLQVVVGVKLLVERALMSKAELILIDTSGMVQGPLGILLKRHKIELVHPTHLLVLQKEQEMEGLLERLHLMSGTEVYRLPVSPQSRSRSAAERRAYRQQRFAAYFQDFPARWINLSHPRYLLSGFSPSMGRLLGLLDASGETLGLGVIRRYGSGRIELITPVTSLDTIRILQPARIRLGRDWSETSV